MNMTINRTKTLIKVSLIISGYILASLLLSAGLEVLNNGDILDMCNTFSEAYGGNVMFYDSPGLSEQDLRLLTTSVVLTMQGFYVSQNFLNIAFLALISSMSFWFRDVISESTYQGFHTLGVHRGLNNNFVSDSPLKKNNSKGTNTNGLPIHLRWKKKPNWFILFIKKLFSQIFTRKFLYSSLIIFTTGFMGRYLIKSYFDINVLTDYLHIVSISYYFGMAFFSFFIDDFFSNIKINIPINNKDISGLVEAIKQLFSSFKDGNKMVMGGPSSIDNNNGTEFIKKFRLFIHSMDRTPEQSVNNTQGVKTPQEMSLDELLSFRQRTQGIPKSDKPITELDRLIVNKSVQEDLANLNKAKETVENYKAKMVQDRELLNNKNILTTEDKIKEKYLTKREEVYNSQLSLKLKIKHINYLTEETDRQVNKYNEESANNLPSPIATHRTLEEWGSDLGSDSKPGSPEPGSSSNNNPVSSSNNNSGSSNNNPAGSFGNIW